MPLLKPSRAERALPILLACLPAALLPACGGGGDGGGVTPPPDQVPPAVVTDLRATAAADGEITLAWTAPGDDGAAGTAGLYELRRVPWVQRALAWEGWEPVAGLPAPAAAGSMETFTVSGLQAGEVYLFRLRARDEALWSDPGNVAVATASPELDTTPPAPPIDLAVWSAARTWVTVSWSGVRDDDQWGEAVAGYELRWSAAPITAQNWDAATRLLPDPAPGAPGARVTATVSGLEPERTYHVAVRARDERGNVSALSASLPAATVRFRTWRIRPDGTGDAPTIRAACVDSATRGDVILLAPGRYTWTAQGGDPYYGMIYVPRDSTGWTLRGETGAAATIIDAEGRGRVLFIQGISPEPVGGVSTDPADNITVEGVTFTGGNAMATAGGDSAGGGAIGHLAAPTFRDCVFAANRAYIGGGFAFGGWGEAQLERCLFTENFAEAQGGAVALFNSEQRHVLRQCDLLHNEAGSAGGAVRAMNVSFKLDGCLLAGNDGGDLGGGISVTLAQRAYGSAEPSEIVGCTIVGNAAASGSCLRVRDTPAGVLVATRTILADGRLGYAFSFEGANLSLGCSLVHGNFGGDVLPAAVIQLGGNRFDDPRFCDPTGENYRLQATSPCLPENRSPADACGVIGARAGGC